MPALSFRCVVSALDETTKPDRQRSWITGDDFHALAVAGTAKLGLQPEECEYSLFQPEDPQAGVFLEITGPDASARVGPMGGPIPPASIAPVDGYSLPVLLGHLGFGPDGQPGAPDSYVVVVRYANIWDREAFPPLRDPQETTRAYEARYHAIEQRRIARARHEGVHLISYARPVKAWTAADLERVLAAMYHLLPARAPRGRDCAVITEDTVVQTPTDGVSPHIKCLRVTRGDYAAYLRLPTVPSHALSEWIAARRWAINLRVGGVCLETMTRSHPAGEPPMAHVASAAA